MSDQFPYIATERLSLRRLTASDWKEICFLRTDPKVNQYVSRPTAETKSDALQFVQKIDSSIDLKTSFYWCISEKPDALMIGSICLYNFSTDQFSAEIGFDLHPEHQHKGIMTEALHAILRYGFDTLGLRKIIGYTHFENQSSRSLLEKNKFVLTPGPAEENIIVYELQKSAHSDL